MPNVNDLKNSQFLTKEDVEPPIVVTIKGYKEQNVEMENKPERKKWTLYFHELPKPMVLNMTNGMLLKQITGSDDFDDWIGKKVVLYNDETVMFGGEFTGGIRIRAIKAQTQKTEITEPEIPATDESGSPYCPHCGNLHKDCSCEPDF